MDMEGQWLFGSEMVTMQVPCPSCGAAPGEPCTTHDGRPYPSAVLHGGRTCLVIEVVHEPTGPLTEKKDLNSTGSSAARPLK